MTKSQTEKHPSLETKMTPSEIAKEWEYRYSERLAISAGANKPTPEHFAQAKKEADRWRDEYERQYMGEWSK